jgi:hypothetical protein
MVGPMGTTPKNGARVLIKNLDSANRQRKRLSLIRAPVKKAARKERMKQHVTPVVEIVAAEVIEQPAPNAITVTEIEETRKAS